MKCSQNRQFHFVKPINRYRSYVFIQLSAVTEDNRKKLGILEN